MVGRSANNRTPEQETNINGRIESFIARDDSKTNMNPVNSETGVVSEDTKGVTLKINLVMVD